MSTTQAIATREQPHSTHHHHTPAARASSGTAPKAAHLGLLRLARISETVGALLFLAGCASDYGPAMLAAAGFVTLSLFVRAARMERSL